jgi:hypothetical protein
MAAEEFDTKQLTSHSHLPHSHSHPSSSDDDDDRDALLDDWIDGFQLLITFFPLTIS